MPIAGLLGLLVALVASAASALLLLVGFFLSKKKEGETVETVLWAGRVVALVSAAALTFCVGVLAFCFLTDNYSIMYVLSNRSTSTSSLGWLYKLSGIWAGREGSLLFWAWLVSVFGAVVSARRLNAVEALDNNAVMVIQIVLVAFVGVLMFSEDNMPFFATDALYFESDGTLTSAASMLGMNSLLEHWAMAVHPPTLFIGYSGLTVPFAYAVSTLMVGAADARWVERSTRFALFSWLFLTAGIGLGAVWAYVVLGWGGYWGWDPVENASLLSWLVATALVHSFTLYRTKNAAKGWSIMCAGLAFSFVIVGTFISRSGLVQSVHAFEGDMVSLVLFLVLIVAGIVVPALGLGIRHGAFSAKKGEDDFESFMSKSAFYFINNVFMVIMAVVITYMTMSSALPSWLPFGGESLSTASYNALARPLGVLYLLIMAVCPLVGWSKTDPKAFMRIARVPLVCAVVLFAVLLGYTLTTLFPAYDATIAAGGSNAESLLEAGPAAYYKGLTVLGMLVASLLFFNSLYLLVRCLRAKKKRAAGIGGALAHVGMAVILVGLIGSSMYVTERSGYMDYDAQTNTSSGEFCINQYTLQFTGSSIDALENGNVRYQIELDVFESTDDDTDEGTLSYIGHVSPSVEVVASTQQQKLNAGVVGFPLEDLFVVYRGVNSATGALSLDVMVNPLISFVWAGLMLLMLGMGVSSFGRRARKGEGDKLPEYGARAEDAEDVPDAQEAGQ